MNVHSRDFWAVVIAGIMSAILSFITGFLLGSGVL